MKWLTKIKSLGHHADFLRGTRVRVRGRGIVRRLKVLFTTLLTIVHQMPDSIREALVEAG